MMTEGELNYRRALNMATSPEHKKLLIQANAMAEQYAMACRDNRKDIQKDIARRMAGTFIKLINIHKKLEGEGNA